MTIELQLAITDTETVPPESLFAEWVNLVCKQEQRDGTVTIRIVDSAESQSLNYAYREKDKPTNVLSFPFELPPGIPSEEANELGDLVICKEIVELEAKQQKKDVNSHWAHLVIHGCLHLIGYDHINNQDAELMESKEIALLATLNIDNPYIEQE